jgi:hypothetical protein
MKVAQFVSYFCGRCLFPLVTATGVCFVLALLLSGLEIKAQPQTLVVPRGYEEVPGEGAGFAFGEGARYQTVYSASQFLSHMPEGGIITAVALRIDESNRNTWGGITPEIEIAISTAPSLAPIITLNFAENVGADRSVVFSRQAVSYSVGPGTDGVNPFHLLFPLENRFYYDPRNGALTLEFFSYQTPFPGLLIDGGRGNALSGAIGVAQGRPAAALVTEVFFTPVPEPGSSLIACGAILLFIERRFRP